MKKIPFVLIVLSAIVACTGRWAVFNHVNSIYIYSFDENEKHIPFKRPNNLRYEKALNDAYSTITPMSNPVLHIYKCKDVE